MSKLQIGIDINEANVVKRVGTGQYTYHILKRWAELKDFDFHLYHRDSLLPDMPAADHNWHYHHVVPSRAWVRFGLPLHLLLSGRRHDVFWSPAHYMPPITLSPSVVTIHDLAYEYFPELFLPSDLYKLKHWTRKAVRQATRVIAVSEATKSDLVSFYHVDPEKITVVYNGYDRARFNPDFPADRNLLAKWSLGAHYLLYIGTVQPRKNVIRLIEAFHELRTKGYTGKLVIAGNIGWMADETLQKIQTCPDKDYIVLTGYVSEDERSALYKYADLTTLPSLMEGFGVPLVESMGVGTPVAASNNSSLPEVVGQAGVLFNPLDSTDIARGIREVLTNRDHYAKLALTQASQFSWDKCAKDTLEVIRSVCQK